MVRDGRIAEIGPSRNVRVPAGARRVDGRGKYLIPGLADMHTHLYSDGAVPDSVGAVRAGRDGGERRHRYAADDRHAGALDAAARHQAGRIAGPAALGREPAVRREGGRQQPGGDHAGGGARGGEGGRRTGYDFVKLTLFIPGRCTTRSWTRRSGSGSASWGTWTRRSGVARAIAAGQQIEHLDNYFEVGAGGLRADEGIGVGPGTLPAEELGEPRLHRRREARRGSRARPPASGSGLLPTLKVFKKAFAMGQTDEEIRARPDWNLMPPEDRKLYLGAREKYWARPASEARRHALRGGAQPAGEGDRRLGREDHGGLGHARVVLRLRLGASTASWRAWSRPGSRPTRRSPRRPGTRRSSCGRRRSGARSSGGSGRTCCCWRRTRWRTSATRRGSRRWCSVGAGSAGRSGSG